MDLLKDKIQTLYFKYLAASLWSAVVMSIYSFVDTIAVGQAEGPAGAAAMAIITPLYGITVFLAILAGIGGSVLMGKARGEGNDEKGNAYFTASAFLMLLLVAAFWLIFAFNSDRIFMFFGADAELLPMVNEYAQWIVHFCPLFLLSPYLGCLIRNDNAPGLAMRAVITGGIINIFGDWFFVFPLGMGIEGAAIATVLGTGIQFLILCSHFLTKKCNLRLVRPFQMFRALRKITATGFSSGLIDLAAVILACIVNNQVMRYGGPTALAVFGVVSVISGLFQSLYSGVGQALQPIVSTNFGAQEHGRIQSVLRMSAVTVLIMGMVFMLAGLLFPNQIIRLFMDATPDVLEIAPELVRMYFPTFLFMGVNVMATYYLQSVMRIQSSLVVALLRGVVLSGALLYLLPIFLKNTGVWIAVPIAEGITAAIALYFLRQVKKTKALS